MAHTSPLPRACPRAPPAAPRELHSTSTSEPKANSQQKWPHRRACVPLLRARGAQEVVERLAHLRVRLDLCVLPHDRQDVAVVEARQGPARHLTQLPLLLAQHHEEELAGLDRLD